MSVDDYLMLRAIIDNSTRLHYAFLCVFAGKCLDWTTRIASLTLLSPGGLLLLEGVIRGAHQRPGFHVPESHLLAQALVFRKLTGMHEAHDGQVFARRLQILPQREDVHALSGQFG